MNLQDALTGHPLLDGLPREKVGRVAECAGLQRFAAGDTLLRQDVEIRDFYLLLKGRVALQINPAQAAPMCIQTLNGGEVLGWSWLIPPYRSFFDATALDEVTAIAVDCARMRELMESDHDFGYAVLKRIFNPMLLRLHACRLQLLDVYGEPGKAES